MVSAMAAPGTVTVCSPMALNMSSMMRPASGTTPISCWPRSPRCASRWMRSRCSTRTAAASSPGERIERMLDVFGVTRSLSRPGNPYDNAVVESTNRLVKKELIHRNVYTNVEQLRSDVNRYVWWYNHQRLHSTLGYLSPVEFTQQGKTL